MHRTVSHNPAAGITAALERNCTMAKSNRSNRAPRTTILAATESVMDTAAEVTAEVTADAAPAAPVMDTAPAPAVAETPHAAAIAYLASFDPTRLPAGMHARFLARGNVTRMGRVALAAAGVELDTEQHRAYNELRSGFWSRMGGTLPRREGSTRTTGGARAPRASGSTRGARVAAFAARSAAASQKLAAIFATVPAGAMSITIDGEASATTLAKEANNAALLAAVVARVVAQAPPESFEAPKAAVPAAAPIPLTVGGFAVLTPAGRRSCVEGGLIDEPDATGKFTILALPDGGKVATVRAPSGDRTRVATRFLVGTTA